MFGKIETPFSIHGPELDEYLEKGWFRMGQAIFTCNILNFDRRFYSAIWLRLCLKDYKPDAAFLRLKKMNAGFRVSIQPATITRTKEKLYTKYKKGITFETASSLSSLLVSVGRPSVYKTMEINVYDGEELIAVGYFDLGNTSVAGIVSFYDPDYKKHSLGKYLIYNKIEYSVSQGYSYFYPGYFTPSYPIFDYKLTIGRQNLEFLDVYTQAWYPIANFQSVKIPIVEITTKLSEIEKILSLNEIQYQRFKYEFYNANTILHLKDLDLFEYPEFIFVLSPAHVGYIPVLVFDVLQQKFRLLRCISCYCDVGYVSTDGYYGTHLMKIVEELFASEDPNSFPELFMDQFQQWP